MIDAMIRPEQEGCEVRISDDGKGIDDENKPLVFERGAKFGPSGNAGLGMFIAMRAMQR